MNISFTYSVSMKYLLRPLLIAAAIAPMLTSCASQDEVQRLRYQLHTVNKKLAEMENSTVGDIQKQQAASSNQMEMMEREILVLKGQLEETNMQNRLLQEQNQALQSNVGNIAKEEAQRREEALQQIAEEQRKKEALIVELNEKLKAQEESLQAIQDARVRDAERRAQEAKSKADAAKARALAASAGTVPTDVVSIRSEQNKRLVSDSAPQVTAQQSAPEVQSAARRIEQPESTPKPSVATTAPTPAPQPEPAQKQPVEEPKTAPAVSGLESAKQLFAQNQYDKAYNEFEKVASANPTSEDGVTAGYMMGECLYAQKEYDKAILQYQKIISQNSTHPKAASATLKQGMAFERLADAETAKMIYKKLVNHYGSAPEAKIAQEKLDSL